MTQSILAGPHARFSSRFALISFAILMAATSARASTPCTTPPMQPETMDVLVHEYQKQADRRELITSSLTEKISSRWINGAPDRTALKSLLASLLAKSHSGAEFNTALSSELAILCSIFTPATSNADSARIAASAEEAKPSQAFGKQASTNAEKKTGNTTDGSAADTVTPQPTNPNESVKQTLDAKVELAKGTIAGKVANHPDIHIDRLLSYHSAIFSCIPSTPDVQPDRNSDLTVEPAAGHSNVCTDEAAIKSQLCISTWDKTARCSRRVFEEIDERNDLLTKLHEESKSIKADAEQTETLAALQRKYGKEVSDALSQEALRSGGFYGFYAGPSFLLQDGGDWKSGTEVYANFVTEAFDRGHCLLWWMCRAYFDASFVTPDAFPSEVEDDSTSPIAVFDSKGRLRIRGAVQAHWSDWLGAEVGVGVTSPISDRSTSVRAESCAHIGAHFQTAFPDRAVGEVFLGYARDKSWERLVDADGDLTTTADQRVEERFDRLILDGTLLFPGVELGGFSLGVRLSADVPWSGDTQSEIRGSILLYYSFNKELEKYRPKLKQSQPAQ